MRAPRKDISGLVTVINKDNNILTKFETDCKIVTARYRKCKKIIFSKKDNYITIDGDIYNGISEALFRDLVKNIILDEDKKPIEIDMKKYTHIQIREELS